MNYRNEFEKFLHTTLTAEEFASLPARIGSPHRVTKICKNPEIATNHDVVVIAQLAGCTAASLIDTYQLGRDGLSYEEKKYHSQYAELLDHSPV